MIGILVLGGDGGNSPGIPASYDTASTQRLPGHKVGSLENGENYTLAICETCRKSRLRSSVVEWIRNLDILSRMVLSFIFGVND